MFTVTVIIQNTVSQQHFADTAAATNMAAEKNQQQCDGVLSI